MIYFIYGASGSGKSAILDLLKINNLEISFHDFDDIGVPDNADKIWRQKSTNKWIEQYISTNKNMCICGGAVPAEVISVPAFKKLSNVKFCLLDCDDITRVQRLYKRNTYGPNQDIINWSAWLRIQATMPSWETPVVTEDSWTEMDFSKLLGFESWPDNLKPLIIDTSKLSISAVADEVQNIFIKGNDIKHVK